MAIIVSRRCKIFTRRGDFAYCDNVPSSSSSPPIDTQPRDLPLEDDHDRSRTRDYGDVNPLPLDTDNLDDKEKALLCRYLQAEYEKDPESLPMPREVVEEFLARNQNLLDQLDDLDDDGQGQLEMRVQCPSTGLDDADFGENLNICIDYNY